MADSNFSIPVVAELGCFIYWFIKGLPNKLAGLSLGYLIDTKLYKAVLPELYETDFILHKSDTY